MKNILYTALLLLLWASVSSADELINHESLMIGDYELTLRSYENSEINEKHWFYSTLEVDFGTESKRYDFHDNLYKSSDIQTFVIKDVSIVYFQKLGGSGGGAGLYRYIPSTKSLTLFEGGSKEFPSFNEVYKYEDVNGDGAPEIFATSREYGDDGFTYYWTVYEWPISSQKPHVADGDDFKEMYVKIAEERLSKVHNSPSAVLNAERKVLNRIISLSDNQRLRCKSLNVFSRLLNEKKQLTECYD